MARHLLRVSGSGRFRHWAQTAVTIRPCQQVLITTTTAPDGTGYATMVLDSQEATVCTWHVGYGFSTFQPRGVSRGWPNPPSKSDFSRRAEPPGHPPRWGFLQRGCVDHRNPVRRGGDRTCHALHALRHRQRRRRPPTHSPFHRLIDLPVDHTCEKYDRPGSLSPPGSGGRDTALT